MLGSIANKEIRANCVTDPVFRYTQTPKANRVSPEPINDTSWPNQIKVNIRILQMWVIQETIIEWH
ncbi:hypothetical protein [Nostoc sp. LPT]|uniref:hypothetical protein n=1 Tax=Nostoc sp. LPT TaxID=2815387 RepID=UPI0025E74000|nr:hypothetical protein [Nostoc sp. LPT]